MTIQSSTCQSTASARFSVRPPGHTLQPSFVTGLPAPESGPNRQGSPAGWLKWVQLTLPAPSRSEAAAGAPLSPNSRSTPPWQTCNPFLKMGAVGDLGSTQGGSACVACNASCAASCAGGGCLGSVLKSISILLAGLLRPIGASLLPICSAPLTVMS